MNTVLWIVQGLLTLLFLATGISKAALSKQQLAPRMKWVETFSPTAIRVIGGIEILLAVGLVLPMIIGIPWLTPLAALGLVALMAGAAVVHFRRKEFANIGINTVVLLLCLMVAYGRFALMLF
jgi:hypothetical protein